MQRIKQCLWFDGQAEEASLFYTGIFPNSTVSGTARTEGDGLMPTGNVVVANFTLDGQEFMALNGGPQYKFTPAISMVISCKDKTEVEYYWSRLTAGGEPGRCGWLTDQFGVSWQVVPRLLGELMERGDQAQCGRVMTAMMEMTKLDSDRLQAAFDGTS